jgi:D-cysteine desulfhydrase
VGALGFLHAATELATQLAARGHAHHDEVVVVIPTGSGASLAGLLAGRAALDAKWRIYGVSVSRRPRELGALVLELAEQCAASNGTPPPVESDLTLIDSVGEGFGRVTDQDRGSMLLALTSEGVLVDPTYGAKAVTAAVRLIEAGDRAPLVLWHTGGLPAALEQSVTPVESR